MTNTKNSTGVDRLIGIRLKEALKTEPGGGAGLGRRLGRFLGKDWTRQAVYEAGAGDRHFRIADLVALARATNRPAHYFLDAAAEGIDSVEFGPGAEPVTAEELLNLFRIPEPRDPASVSEVVVNYMRGTAETLRAEAAELEWAAGLIAGPEGDKS